MRVTIDEETCVACVACVEICQEVFEMKDDKVLVKIEEFPKEVSKACQEASENCPVEAIKVEK